MKAGREERGEEREGGKKIGSKEMNAIQEKRHTFNTLSFSGCHDNGKSYRFGETITQKDKCEKW
jgi:hypothetical protein